MLGRLTVAVALVAIGVVALLDVTGILAPHRPPLSRHRSRSHRPRSTDRLVLGPGEMAGDPGTAHYCPAVRSPLLAGDLGLQRHQPGHPPTREVDDLLPEYSVDTGSMLLDLGALNLDGAAVAVEVSVGAGELIVQLPEGAAVDAVVTAEAGEIEILGQDACTGPRYPASGFICRRQGARLTSTPPLEWGPLRSG